MLNKILYAIIMILNACQCYAGTVTTLSLVEKEGITTNNYPLTFGHVFKQGDVISGIAVRYNGDLITTQFDKKTSWPDGSAKIGVISVVIPTVTANGTGTISIETAASNSSSGSLDKTSILSTDVESNINLSNISGSGYSGSAASSLRDQINSGDLVYWLQGSVCTEVLETQQLNNSLNTAWEARFYPGTSFGIRISNSVENVNILYRGNVGYDVSIQQGESSPSTVYSKSGFTHLHGSRWRKVFWLGAEPPETELHYDLPYLVSTGAIPNYSSWETPFPQSAISIQASLLAGTNTDIDGNGQITKSFGLTGGRQELGIIPMWQSQYLLTFDNRLKNNLIINAQMAGHVARAHWREGDVAKSNYSGIVTVDDRVTYDLIADVGGGIPTAIGSMDMGGWSPDRSHLGSFCYLPYLITGEKWFLDETRYWGAYAISYDEYGRNGAGNTQNFSSGKDASYGMIYDQARGVAWGTRAVSDALFVLPDTYNAEIAYFTSKLNNILTWLDLANRAGKHGVHAFRGPRESQYAYANVYEHAPWQHDFMVITLAHIRDQKHGDQSIVGNILTYLSYFTAGRFTNHPTFNKWDATGYWWPLADDGGSTYYSEGDWAGYWNDVLNTDGATAAAQGLPHASWEHYNNASEYLAIANAALAALGSTYLYNETKTGISDYYLTTSQGPLYWSQYMTNISTVLPPAQQGRRYPIKSITKQD